MAEGWVKLHRNLLESQCFADANILRVWVWIMLKVTHKPRYAPIRIGAGNSTVQLKRGQMLFGRFAAEEELAIGGSSIYRYMQKLEKWGTIKMESNSHYTIVTVCNYEEYQSEDEKGEQPVDKQWTAGEQHLNNTWTTPEQHLNTDKNVKKVENVKNGKNVEKVRRTSAPATEFDPSKDEYYLDENFRRAWADFVHMRGKTREPLNPLAIKLKFQDLRNAASDPNSPMRSKYLSEVEYAADMLDQSTSKNWQGVFPVKPWFYDAKTKKLNGAADYGGGFTEN